MSPPRASQKNGDRLDRVEAKVDRLQAIVADIRVDTARTASLLGSFLEVVRKDTERLGNHETRLHVLEHRTKTHSKLFWAVWSAITTALGAMAVYFFGKEN